MRPIKRRDLVIIVVLFTSVGVGFTYINVNTILAAAASGSWPYVEGQVTWTQFRHSDSHVYQKVRYRYVVGGREYSSEQISFARAHRPARSKQTARRYTEGQSVRVYYNPENPANAVIEPGLSYFPFLLLLLGLAFLVVGVGLAVGAILGRVPIANQ